jgi:hypothetical protein
VGDKTTIAALITFKYTLEHHDTRIKEGPLLCSIKIYEAADFYVIPHLVKLAFKALKKSLRDHWSCEDFLQCLEYVYSNDFSYSELRDIVIKGGLRHSDELASSQQLTEMLSRKPELAKDFAFSMLPKVAKLTKFFQCEDCNYI